jgi:fatty acid desaturase
VGLPLAFLLVAYLYSIGGPSYAVVGGILGGLIATSSNVVWGAYWDWKNYSVKADFRTSTKVLASSALAAVAAYLFITLLSLPYILLLVGSFLIFLSVYLTVAPLIGAINNTDLDNLKSKTSNLGMISKILDLPLIFMRKIYNINNHKNKKEKRFNQSQKLVKRSFYGVVSNVCH